MSEARSNVPFSQLVGELKTLCQGHRTGTAYIVTDDNRMARFGLNAGEIDFVWFHSKRGLDGLTMMSQVHAGRLRFEDGVKAAADDADLPSTAKILEFLASAGSEVEVPASTSPRGSPAVSSGDQAVIEEVLTEFIGPMASIICDERLNAAYDLESALSALAAEIQDSGQIQDFLDRVHARLA